MKYYDLPARPDLLLPAVRVYEIGDTFLPEQKKMIDRALADSCRETARPVKVKRPSENPRRRGVR